jgi:hypothetical protein
VPVVKIWPKLAHDAEKRFVYETRIGPHLSRIPPQNTPLPNIDIRATPVLTLLALPRIDGWLLSSRPAIEAQLSLRTRPFEVYGLLCPANTHALIGCVESIACMPCTLLDKVNQASLHQTDIRQVVCHHVLSTRTRNIVVYITFPQSQLYCLPSSQTRFIASTQEGWRNHGQTNHSSFFPSQANQELQPAATQAFYLFASKWPTSTTPSYAA